MREAQDKLLIWIKEVGLIRYERIKESCDYLNLKLNLGIEKNPIYYIFYPLLYSGVVEFASDGKFHIAPTCVIIKPKKEAIVVNPHLHDDLDNTNYVGIYRGINDKINGYTFNLEMILKEFPSIDKHVRSFDKQLNWSPNDFNKKQGVAKKNNDSIISYFIDKEYDECYPIPHQSTNPDAINIASCFERVLSGEYNGIYREREKELHLKMYRAPILIYRALMIETLLCGTEPLIENHHFVFKNISKRAYMELNRIFCKSIISQ